MSSTSDITARDAMTGQANMESRSRSLQMSAITRLGWTDSALYLFLSSAATSSFAVALRAADGSVLGKGHLLSPAVFITRP